MTNPYREPEDLGGRFRFHAGIEDDLDFDDDGNRIVTAWYAVKLPHQCGDWTITEGPDKAEAITAVETFIAEAQAALTKLKETP